MIQISFVGAYDKINLIMYVSKILETMKKKVLVVDCSLEQKTRYMVPSIFPTKSYVTEFEGIDFAVGFENIEHLSEYLGGIDDYDLIIYDIDKTEMIQQLDIKRCYKNFFVTSEDLYSLKKGAELLSSIEENIVFTKIIFSNDVIKEEEQYLEYLLLGSKIEWDKTIFFPVLLDDYCVAIENQAVSKIKIKKLSNHYKESLIYIMMMILGENSLNNIKKAIKMA